MKLATESNSMTVLIDTLGLSSRALNCLKLKNIRTVSSLTKYSKEELLQIKGFSKKSLDEVVHKLQERGLRLFEHPLEKHNFSSRTFNVLRQLRIQNLEDLSCVTEEEILSIRNAGMTVVDEIKQKLQEAGMGLKISKKSQEKLLRKSFDLQNEVVLAGKVSQVFCKPKSETLLFKIVLSEGRDQKQIFRCVYYGIDVEMKAKLLKIDSFIQVKARVYKGIYQENSVFKVHEFSAIHAEEFMEIVFSGFIENPVQTKTGVRFNLTKNDREFLTCTMNSSDHIERLKFDIRQCIDAKTPIVIRSKNGYFQDKTFVVVTDPVFEKALLKASF